MQAASVVSALPGVTAASLVMGTPANLAVLAEAGLLDDNARAAGPNDLVIVVDGDDDALGAALVEAEASLRPLSAAGSASERPRPRSLTAAAAAGDPNLALISVPGPYAASEALKALRLGLHVFLFSDNVPVADEIFIKECAERARLIVMGPDCGTAVVAGVPLGFANQLRRGPVGLAGASGTGLQQVSVLIDRWGVGVSHILGTGSRDVSAEVGGRSTRAALAALAADPTTEVIVLVAKPPAPAVATHLLDQAAGGGKPVVACFLGTELIQPAPSVTVVRTLEDAARAAVRLAGGAPPEDPPGLLPASGAPLAAPSPPHGGLLRALYTGGTFAYEAAAVLGAGPRHVIGDLGADEFTIGRPHPMIDPAVRVPHLREALADPATAVVLLDVVTGYGASADPVAPLLPVLESLPSGGPVVIAFVVGTEADPQPRSVIERRLEKAGVLLAESSTAALRLAARALSGVAA
jgi:FdrA protein